MSKRPVKFEKHIEVAEPQSVIDCLAEKVDLSRQTLKQCMLNGALWLEDAHGIHRLRRAKKQLHKGNKIHFYYSSEVQQTKPPVAGLVADEGAYSIWNKPCGMYSQGTRWGDHCSIYRWAEQHLEPQRPAFIVHRLDRAANGLIIIAHKKTVAASFSRMFENHEIYKKYRLTVEGLLEDIVLPLQIKNTLDNKPAISEIISLLPDGVNNTTQLEIIIKTGRKHQIRRHVSEMGYPIVGDRMYGAKDKESDLQLSSVRLEFVSPVNSERVSYSLD